MYRVGRWHPCETKGCQEMTAAYRRFCDACRLQRHGRTASQVSKPRPEVQVRNMPAFAMCPATGGVLPHTGWCGEMIKTMLPYEMWSDLPDPPSGYHYAMCEKCGYYVLAPHALEVPTGVEPAPSGVQVKVTARVAV